MTGQGDEDAGGCGQGAGADVGDLVELHGHGAVLRLVSES